MAARRPPGGLPPPNNVRAPNIPGRNAAPAAGNNPPPGGNGGNRAPAGAAMPPGNPGVTPNVLGGPNPATPPVPAGFTGRWYVVSSGSMEYNAGNNQPGNGIVPPGLDGNIVAAPGQIPATARITMSALGKVSFIIPGPKAQFAISFGIVQGTVTTPVPVARASMSTWLPQPSKLSPVNSPFFRFNWSNEDRNLPRCIKIDPTVTAPIFTCGALFAGPLPPDPQSFRWFLLHLQNDSDPSPYGEQNPALNGFNDGKGGLNLPALYPPRPNNGPGLPPAIANNQYGYDDNARPRPPNPYGYDDNAQPRPPPANANNQPRPNNGPRPAPANANNQYVYDDNARPRPPPANANNQYGYDDNARVPQQPVNRGGYQPGNNNNNRGPDDAARAGAAGARNDPVPRLDPRRTGVGQGFSPGEAERLRNENNNNARGETNRDWYGGGGGGQGGGAGYAGGGGGGGGEVY